MKTASGSQTYNTEVGRGRCWTGQGERDGEGREAKVELEVWKHEKMHVAIPEVSLSTHGDNSSC